MRNPFGLKCRIVATHQFLELPFIAVSACAGVVLSGGEGSGKSSVLYDLMRKSRANGDSCDYLFCRGVDSLEKTLVQLWMQPLSEHLCEKKLHTFFSMTSTC